MPVYLRLKETADEMAQEIKSTGQRSGMGTRKAEIYEAAYQPTGAVLL